MLSTIFDRTATGSSLGLINAVVKNDKNGVSEALQSEADVNCTVGDLKNTALHLAIKNDNEEIAKILIKEHADVNCANRLGRSPLHEAAHLGNIGIVKELIKFGANINHLDNERWSPLHFAAAKGSTEVVSYLLENCPTLNINRKNLQENTPLHIAALFNKKHVAQLLIDNGADAVSLNNDEKSPIKIMTEKSFDAQFFFKVVPLHNDADILAQMTSPIRFVNSIMKEHDSQLSLLGQEVCEMLQTQNAAVVHYLLVWHHSLIKAARSHSNEKVDIMAVAELVEDAINEIFSSDSMDDPINVQRVLQPHNSSIASIRDLPTNSARQRELYRTQLMSFKEEGLLDLCLRHQCKFLFGRQQISGFIATAFRAPSRSLLHRQQQSAAAGGAAQGTADGSSVPGPDEEKEAFSSRIPMIGRIEESFKFNIFDPKLFGLSYSLRSCPAAMFCLELFFKLTFIVVIASVGIADYGERYGVDYNTFSKADHFSINEGFLITMVVGGILYELGQLAETGWKLSAHFEDEWNILDCLSFLILLAWLYFRVVIGNGAMARVLLALVAIPECTGVLRYLSVSKTLGVIVATSRAMFYDLVAFLAVYVVCVLGFGVFFYSLFYGSDSFSTAAQTASQMFQYTLTNFDFSVFDSTSEMVNDVAQVVLAIYLILTAVLLLNLLVARMTNAYQRVDDKAVQEWSFAKTQTVTQFLILKERHPFCMMPAPLNLLTTALYPLHVYFMKTSNMSLAGTVSNVLLTYIGAPIRAYSLMYCFRSGMKVILFRLYTRNKHRPAIALLLLCFTFTACTIAAFYLMVHAVIFYPMFAWDDLTERLDSDSCLSYLAMNKYAAASDANDDAHR
ncbi:hypothetical protein EON64_05510 [archaeon]|nr:MAG: hypothetical protein EON64_05510 [archaeon]